jgi:hypothetical protein
VELPQNTAAGTNYSRQVAKNMKEGQYFCLYYSRTIS